MADYLAKSTNSLAFDVTQGDQFIGKLSYKSWFSFTAIIEMANQATYQVDPKGFWGTTIEVKDAAHRLLTFTLNWHGDIVMETYFNNVERGYIFKHRGIFNESFVLTDQEGVELLVMKPHLKWQNMTYEYQIVTSDRFNSFSTKELLLLTSLHCANYYMSMLATGIAT
ncbi:hypothetical protein [Dyadobacter sp. BHUBP1]|uniref:hypothetical protein n=1 Tax=Dyadobacter sp. BHUBP1 TaxID=3424178 RepID=UPI003D352518